MADVILRILSDRSRPTPVRIDAMGVFLEQLTTRYSSRIRFGVEAVGKFDAEGRKIIGYDSVRVANLYRVSPARRGVGNVEDNRNQVLAIIDRILADASEPKDMRLAAKEVAWAIRHGNE